MSHQYETLSVAEDNTGSAVYGLLAELGDGAWRYIYDYENTETKKYYQTPQKIIVHHSATTSCDTAAMNRSHLNRTNGYNTTSKGDDISYHYIIQADGSLQNTREDNEVGRGTKFNNIDVIHILFCGNFNETEPTKEQYMEGASIIGELRKLYGDLPVYGHNQLEGEATACPGKNFDYRMLLFYATEVKGELKEEGELLGMLDITKYYSCDPNQTKYLSREVNVLKRKLGRDPTNQELYNECNRRQFGGDVDNLQPKHGAEYTNNDAGVAVACPKNIPGWTKLKIEGYGEVVCRDVGSAITEGRLDLFVGIGDWAVNNYNKFPSGQRRVWVLNG